MMNIMSLFGRPGFLKAFHGWATVAWIVMVPIVAMSDLKASITFLVAVSVYAIVLGHWSSWQAARVEVVQEEEIAKKENRADA